MKNIVIVEDDELQCEWMIRNLGSYKPIIISNEQDLGEYIGTMGESPDAFVLDMMVRWNDDPNHKPDYDKLSPFVAGFRMYDKIRKTGSQTPVIINTVLRLDELKKLDAPRFDTGWRPEAMDEGLYRLDQATYFAFKGSPDEQYLAKCLDRVLS